MGKPTLSFLDKLRTAISTNRSILCIGLDPELARLPPGIRTDPSGVVAFNRAIVEATADLVCAYKPNLAFYEALGREGYGALLDTLAAIPKGIPVIGDAKRGDIGNTARASAVAMFDQLGFDAVTVNPYLGEDSLEPFFDRADRGIFVVCRTSNPGGAELQNLQVTFDGVSRPLYEVVALKTRQWNRNGNAAVVVGATAPSELERIRALTPELPILIPAIGAQGGDVAAAASAHRPDAPAVVNAARAVLYASSGTDYATAARSSAMRLRDQLRELGHL
jgi:orotidine-5'-phosphate decarboxylase